MSFVENMRQRLIIGQMGIIVYSLAAAFLGKTAKTFILALIVIILIQLAISRRGKNQLGQAKIKPEDLMDAQKLFEEKNVQELQMQDKQFILDMQEQSKFTMYSSLGMMIALLYFMLLWKYVDYLHAAVLGFVGDERLAWFLAFLIYFEGLFVINQLSIIWALRKVGKVTMIQAPRSYTITSKGIIIKGIIGKSAIQFPLPEGTTIEVNEKRKFVDLIRPGKRSIIRIRFYTRRVKRLADILRKHGGAKMKEE